MKNTNNNDAISYLLSYFGNITNDNLQIENCQSNGLCIRVNIAELRNILIFLKDSRELMFKILIDLFAVDYPGRVHRFEIIYNLLSIEKNCRVKVIVSAPENAPIPSVEDLYSSANWYEREAWDMYGICFDGSKDLRRILTDYGFDGHPLRKDFPLTGFKEVRYDLEQQKVIYEPVNLSQDYRSFDFLSPWEGTEYPFLKQKMDKGGNGSNSAGGNNTAGSAN